MEEGEEGIKKCILAAPQFEPGSSVICVISVLPFPCSVFALQMQTTELAEGLQRTQLSAAEERDAKLPFFSL